METIPLKAHNLPSHTIFAGRPPELLYHYTMLSGAHGIIASKSLWMTKIKYLSDISELTFSIKSFQNYVSQFVKDLKDNVKIEFLNEASYQLNSFENTNICIASFCEDPNLLSQWRSYGSGNEGVAIGFSSEMIKKYYPINHINLWKCIYAQEVQQKIMHELIEALCQAYDICYNGTNKGILKDLISYFNTLFLQIAPIIKSHHFHEEREWRLITLPVKVTDNDYNVKLISNKRLIPVYEFKFKPNAKNEFECIKNIVIGPSETQKLVCDSLADLLFKNNFNSCGITFSNTPYRKV